MGLSLYNPNSIFRHLESEQILLFEQLVEATNAVARSEREPFMYLRTLGGAFVKGNRFAVEVVVGDVEELVERDLLRMVKPTSSGMTFTVPAKSLAAYTELKKSAPSQVQNVETEIRLFLDGREFKDRHQKSYARWAEASDLYWSIDFESDISTIGLKCREALQFFATELVNEQEQPFDDDVERTVNRLRALVKQYSDRLGTKQTTFFDSLIKYWRSVSDLANLQTHAHQKKGSPLEREDARRVVFQTALVMYEFDRAFHGITAP